MPKTTGVVDSVREIETKIGPMQKITIGAIEYGVLGAAPPIAAGQTVTFDAEKDKTGRFWNARHLTIGAAVPLTITNTPAPGPSIIMRQLGNGDAKDRSIARAVALKAAVEIVTSLDLSAYTGEEIRTQILRNAIWVYKVAYDEKAWDQQVALLGNE